MSTYGGSRRAVRPGRRPRWLVTGGLLAGSLVVGAVGASGVAAMASDRETPVLDAVPVAGVLRGDDTGRKAADPEKREPSSDRTGRQDGRIDDRPGTGSHPVVKVPCDAEKLVAALVQANAEGGGSLRLAPKCTYTLTQAFAQTDDYDGGIQDARDTADAAENAGGATETPGAAAQSPAAVAESPAPAAESPAAVAESPAPAAESPSGVVESPGAAVESPGAGVQTPGDVAETPGDAEAPPPNLADDKAGLPVIYQPIIIDGAGAIIERDKQAEEFRFFTVRDGGELFLRDVELRNGRSKVEGGAIHIVHGATAVVERVTVTSNTSLSKDGGGGGIFNDGNLVASDIRFVGNNATGQPGGLFIERAQVRVDDESVITGNEQTNCVGSTTPVTNCFR